MPDANEIRDTLPVFDNHHGGPEGWTGLRIDGLVANPKLLTADDLVSLTSQILTEDFRCLEGWSVPDQEWQGVPLSMLLDAAVPLPGARYAAVSAGDYTVGIALDSEVANTLLATRLNGSVLPPEHGGPCRLVMVDQACYASVKWVDSVRLTATPPEETARDIARARNEGSRATTP